ncbi:MULTISPECIES: hypothetical protein [unclassified Acinetobacter]|uniref:hypothetical protein n=1 Tax=unclassified Acinetobacter TaxID=196816 RepID=UPI0015D27F8C|nr:MULTISPECIES: hypothetical protein [unclassified Acinetobacter]
MAMKQTQTKLFDFSDVGLDFCAGSKNLFPDRFKKMLALGYNEQTVSSVAVAGNQVTLTYGGTHGYVADRVLKVSAPEILGINGGEFVIDSVTANTVTMTIDGAPASIAGNFTTKVASLGWDLVYELNHIQIYKFKHIDDTDMYARLCFQNATTSGNRNCMAVGIGRTVDLNLGHITDPNCLQDLATCATVAEATSNIRWDFSESTAATFNNYTYSQGYSTFGNGLVVGSKYHIVFSYNIMSGSAGGNRAAVGVVPAMTLNYDVLKYPVLFAQNNGASTTTAQSQTRSFAALIGVYPVRVDVATSSGNEVYSPQANSSFLPNTVDVFNTTVARPIQLFHKGTNQFLGCLIGGVFTSGFSANSGETPSMAQNQSPSIVMDIDFSNRVVLHGFGALWVAIPVEVIKIEH